jgi:tape measure domain-containing protein
MASIRDLFATIGVDIDDKPIKDFDRAISGVKSNVKLLAAGIGVATVSLGFFLKKAGEVEQVEVAFKTMLQSVELSKELLKDLSEFAAKTPFTIPGVRQTAKLLLGMQIESEKLIPTMKFLGDVAAGLSVPIERLAQNFGQIRARTKLTGEELRDFARAGVPIISQLAKQLNVTEGEIIELVSRGKVGFNEVEKAFIAMTSKGGLFFDLMAEQSKTFFGRISNIIDNLITISETIGKKLLPAAKEQLTVILDLLDANRELIISKADVFIRKIASAFKNAVKFSLMFFDLIKSIIDRFGGLERVINFTILALLTLISFRTLSGFGALIQIIFRLTKAVKTLGIVGALTQVKLFFLPFLIGTAFAALILLIDDVIVHLEGKGGRSLSGILINAFEKKYPNAFKVTEVGLTVIIDQLKLLKNIITGFADIIVDLLLFPFAPKLILEEFKKDIFSFLDLFDVKKAPTAKAAKKVKDDFFKEFKKGSIGLGALPSIEATRNQPLKQSKFVEFLNEPIDFVKKLFAIPALRPGGFGALGGLPVTQSAIGPQINNITFSPPNISVVTSGDPVKVAEDIESKVKEVMNDQIRDANRVLKSKVK